jgi:hypothetical protein
MPAASGDEVLRYAQDDMNHEADLEVRAPEDDPTAPPSA